MKKISVLLGCLLVLLSACSSQKATATPVDIPALQILAAQTFIAGVTQTAVANVPTNTPIPTNTPELPTETPTVPIPTNTPVPTTQVPALNLDDFPNKAFLQENDNYAVYLKDSRKKKNNGEIIIYDKNNDLVHPIVGSIKYLPSIILSDDGKGDYVLLSVGSYSSRGAIVISLRDEKQAVNEFCITLSQFGSHFFWNNYVIFNNCDTMPNRPWGMGEAPSVLAVNLITGQITEIAKSDLMHQFAVQAITGDNLQYVETSVEKEEDWMESDKQSDIERIYDLSSLE